jgi:hypothetical protein
MFDLIGAVKERVRGCQEALERVPQTEGAKPGDDEYEESVRLGHAAVEEHLRQLHLYCQLEDLLAPTVHNDNEATWVCVPMGCGFEIEPFVARAAALALRDDARHRPEGRDYRFDANEPDTIDLAEVNEATRIMLQRGATIVRGTMMVTMRTPPTDARASSRPDKDRDHPAFELCTWELLDDQGTTMGPSRIIDEGVGRVEDYASPECLYSACALRDDGDAPYFEHRVFVPTWSISVAGGVPGRFP